MRTLFFLLALIPGLANSADCAIYPSGVPKQAIVDFGNVEVPANTPVGSTVKTYVLGQLYPGTLFFCSNMPYPSGISLFSGGGLGTMTYNGSEYIDIGINGLALQMRNESNDSRGALWSYPPSMSVNGSAIYEQFNNSFSQTLNGRFLGTWSFHLIKTANFVSPGVSIGGNIAKFSHSDGGDLTGINEIASFYLKPITVIAATCTIEDYDKTVFMGNVTTSNLNAPGVISNTTNFKIKMSCQNAYLSPALTFEGDTDTTVGAFKNRTGVLYAKGIGVRLAYGGENITSGTIVSLKPYASTTTYNFSANYIRTGDMTSGNIDVPVTFTLSYE